MNRIMSFAGIFVFLFLAYVFSENRKKISWRIVIVGILLQFVFALLILKTKAGYFVFDWAKIIIEKIVAFSDHGASFVFGKLVNDVNVGAIFAFKVLPIIIFVSSLAGILYFLGVIQFVVKIMAKIMQKTMNISGAEALGTSLFVFMGIEVTTAIRTYIEKMTRSELFTIMSAFMATIATSVMATYVSFGASAGHLLAASVMSAPAAILLSKMLIPEIEHSLTLGKVEFKMEKTDHNIIEAAVNGAGMGLQLALNIGAMVIAFIGLIYLFNSFFTLFHTSLDTILGYVFAPFAFIMGVPWNEALQVGHLLGIRMVFNEFIAYLKLGEFIRAGVLSQRSIIIATYALWGFANFGSMAILIGGVSGVAPSRKIDAADLAFKSMLVGMFASFMTANIAGALIK